jgi:hypothetical protein
MGLREKERKKVAHQNRGIPIHFVQHGSSEQSVSSLEAGWVKEKVKGEKVT